MDHQDKEAEQRRSEARQQLAIMGVGLAIGLAGAGIVWLIWGSGWATLALLLVIAVIAGGKETTKKSKTRKKRTTVPYPENWDELRRQVYERDGKCCINCHTSGVQLHAHHIVPISRGGMNHLSNIVTVCRRCHGRIHPHMRTRFG